MSARIAGTDETEQEKHMSIRQELRLVRVPTTSCAGCVFQYNPSPRDTVGNLICESLESGNYQFRFVDVELPNAHK